MEKQKLEKQKLEKWKKQTHLIQAQKNYWANHQTNNKGWVLKKGLFYFYPVDLQYFVSLNSNFDRIPMSRTYLMILNKLD